MEEYKGYSIELGSFGNAGSYIVKKDTEFIIYFYNDPDKKLAKEWIDAHPLPEKATYIVAKSRILYCNLFAVYDRNDTKKMIAAFYYGEGRDDSSRARAQAYADALNEGTIKLDGEE